MGKDDLGDRMKAYENDDKLIRPIAIRLDGRNFSKFTSDMETPYDPDFTRVMSYVTWELIMETNARVGYTQSDEITLILMTQTPEEEYFFGGKVQKLASVLASMASCHFIYNSPKHWGRFPVFDARVFEVPDIHEAANLLLWRWQDSRRNSISKIGREYLSHKEMQGMSSREVVYSLMNIGIDYHKHFEPKFKNGIFIKPLKSDEEIPRTYYNHYSINDFNSMDHETRVALIRENSSAELNKAGLSSHDNCIRL